MYADICYSLCLFHISGIQLVLSLVNAGIANSVRWITTVSWIVKPRSAITMSPVTSLFRILQWLFSKIFIRGSTNQRLWNKWDASLFSDATQYFHLVVAFISRVCLGSGTEIWRAIDKHFKKIDNDSHFSSKRVLETLRHCAHQIFTLGRHKQRNKSYVHYTHPRHKNSGHC